MIHLGNIRAVGLRHIVSGTSRALRDEGEIALYIGENGESAVYPHHHQEYARHLRVHHKELVGVYRVSPDCNFVPRALYNQIDEDVTHQMLGLRAARRAA